MSTAAWVAEADDGQPLLAVADCTICVFVPEWDRVGKQLFEAFSERKMPCILVPYSNDFLFGNERRTVKFNANDYVHVGASVDCWNGKEVLSIGHVPPSFKDVN